MYLIEIILIVVILAILFYLIILYNRLVRLRYNRKNAFADIDVQLKQRHDLIPQLVETVRGYMKHEQKVLTDVTVARSNAMSAQSISEKISAENQLTSALAGLKIAVEAYPDLKANQNFLSLQEEISDIENKLAASRRYFNAATRELNIACEVFPANLVASMFGFKTEEFFDLGDDNREDLDKTPHIDFSE